MSDIDQQFIEYIVKSVVSKPDKVEIKRTIDERGVLLELSVDPEDLGRVIGKRGATAQSLRTLLRALGTKNEARYNLKIIDTDGGQTRPEPTSQDEPTDQQAVDEPTKQASDQPVADEPVESTGDDAQPISDEEAGKVIEESSAPQSQDDDQNNLASKTRRELAELDDLEV